MYLTVWRDELEEVLDRLGYEVRVHVTEGELLLSNGTDVDAVDCVHHSKPFSCSFQADFSMLKDLPRGNPFCARDLVVLLADSNGVRVVVHAQWKFKASDEAVLPSESE